MNEIKFNINHYVKVKITDYGYSVWVDDINSYSSEPLTTESILKLRDRADEYGYTGFQMHVLMNLFGKHLYLGNKICFNPNIIIIPEK